MSNPTLQTRLLFWLIVAGMVGFVLLIGLIARYQKRGNRRFYPHGSDAPYDGPDPPVRPPSFRLRP